VSGAGQSKHQDTEGALSDIGQDDTVDWFPQHYGIYRFCYEKFSIER